MIENVVAFVWFFKTTFSRPLFKKAIAYHNVKYAEETKTKHTKNMVPTTSIKKMFVR